MAEYTPDKPEKIEWNEHPAVQGLDEFVRVELDRQCEGSFFSEAYADARSINDLKTGARNWAEEQIETFQRLLKKIESLPDSDEEEIEVEDMEHSGSES